MKAEVNFSCRRKRNYLQLRGTAKHIFCKPELQKLEFIPYRNANNKLYFKTSRLGQENKATYTMILSLECRPCKFINEISQITLLLTRFWDQKFHTERYMRPHVVKTNLKAQNSTWRHTTLAHPMFAPRTAVLKSETSVFTAFWASNKNENIWLIPVLGPSFFTVISRASSPHRHTGLWPSLLPECRALLPPLAKLSLELRQVRPTLPWKSRMQVICSGTDAVSNEKVHHETDSYHGFFKRIIISLVHKWSYL